MFKLFLPKISLFLTLSLLLSHLKISAQYEFNLITTSDICLKAEAIINIKGLGALDSVSIKWSNGAGDTKHIKDLAGGDYSVNIRIKQKKDSIISYKDTTLFFSIEKDFCTVSVDKYFSPNDDNYHDKMSVINAQFYPNFEFTVFNKWGQMVHRQKNTYEPWDGKWNGIDLPDGTYYYVFFYDAADKNKLLKGDVTILR